MNSSDITARLTLRFEKDDERTYLASQYYKLPLQVLPPHYQDEDGTAFVYLLNPSGGIMQGDRLLTEITTGKGARVVATTPASTKFYKMEDDHAIVENNITVGEDSVMEYIPEHSVPYRDANVLQYNNFYIDESSILIATDAVSPGRSARGEVFGYTRFCSKSKIVAGGKTVMLDAMDIRPEGERLRAIGSMEDQDIVAGIYLYKQGESRNLCDYIRKEINVPGQIQAGITAVTEDLAVIRILGKNIIDYKDTMAHLWDLARKKMLGKAAVRLRKY